MKWDRWAIAAIYLAGMALAMAGLLYAFVRESLRKRPVRLFDDAPAEAPDAYAAAMIESATGKHGFVWQTTGVSADGRRTRATLLRSADGSTLALVLVGRTGKRGSANRHQTLLLSVYSDGTEVLTSDVGHLERLDPGCRLREMWNADFDELWPLHAPLPDEPPRVPFPEAAGWADVDECVRRSVARQVAAGRAKFVGDDRSRYRLTLRGALRATFGHAMHRRLNPPPADRVYRKRPGSRGGAAVTPAAVASVAGSE